MAQPSGTIVLSNIVNSSNDWAAGHIQPISTPQATSSPQSALPNSGTTNLGQQSAAGPSNSSCGCAPVVPCRQHRICACIPGQLCLTHQPSPNPNTAFQWVKFLACWDCGPIGTFIASIAFVFGAIISYYGLKLAIWTAAKDYIEHCQSDREAQRATVQCQEVADQPLPPPPFFRHDPMDRTIHRRTITSRLLGATVSHRYNDTLIRVYALLLCAVGWLFFSTLFYIVYNIPVVTRQRLLPPLSTQPLDTGAHIWSVPAASDDDELKATSSAVTGRKDSNPTTQYRSYTRPHAASLLQENPDCSSISMDFDSIERSWKERGASFRPRGVFVDDRKRFRLRFEPRSSLRETWYMVWLFAGVDRQVQLLHSMCGLEVSACTGNARRISLIELIFTTPVKRYLRSLSWGKLPFAIAVLRAIESKDTLGFLECYTEHADWRSDFAELIDTCLRILNNTGTDLQGNLHALYTFGSGSTVIVELSGKLYSWAEILKDTRQSFTLAVFTDTCLPANSALNGRRCSGQGNSGEKQVILETKIWFPGSSIPLGPSISSAESVDNQHWVIPPDFAKKRLFFDTNIKMRGHLEIIRAVPYSSHITWYPKQALIARWTHRKQIASLFRFVGRTPFSECLIEEKGKIPITTYIFSGPGEKSEKHEKAD